MNDCRWVFDGDLAVNSFDYVAEQAPEADAYLINGMCNFRSGPNGQPQRPLHLTRMLEERLGKPVVGHDTALYWRIFKSLGLAPATPQGRLLSTVARKWCAMNAHPTGVKMHKIVGLVGSAPIDLDGLRMDDAPARRSGLPARTFRRGLVSGRGAALAPV